GPLGMVDPAEVTVLLSDTVWWVARGAVLAAGLGLLVGVGVGGVVVWRRGRVRWVVAAGGGGGGRVRGGFAPWRGGGGGVGRGGGCWAARGGGRCRRGRRRVAGSRWTGRWRGTWPPSRRIGWPVSCTWMGTGWWWGAPTRGWTGGIRRCGRVSAAGTTRGTTR